jgi:hypothetical protein
MYSSTLSLTSALDGVGRQLHASADLPSGNARYPLYKKLGRPLGWSGRLGKISPLTGILSPDRPARSQSLYRLSYRPTLFMVSLSIFTSHTHSISVVISSNILLSLSFIYYYCYYYYYYYYYYSICMSHVTGLFFPVLLLNQR